VDGYDVAGHESRLDPTQRQQRPRVFGYDFEALLFTEKQGAQFTERLMPPVQGVPSAQEHFVDCILQKKPNIATAEEGLRVMESLDALYLSARKGVPVRMR
jgi:predicted dehydrogenase